MTDVRIEFEGGKATHCTVDGRPVSRSRLDTQDWQRIFAVAGLTELQAEVFRRREIEKHLATQIARDRGTTSANIRNLLRDAWKRLTAHAWTDAEIRWVRSRLERDEADSDLARLLMECFRTQRHSPPTPEYDHLGRQVAQHQALLNHDDHLALHRGGSYVPRCSPDEHKRIKDEIEAELRKRAEQAES